MLSDPLKVGMYTWQTSRLFRQKGEFGNLGTAQVAFMGERMEQGVKEVNLRLQV